MWPQFIPISLLLGFPAQKGSLRVSYVSSWVSYGSFGKQQKELCYALTQMKNLLEGCGAEGKFNNQVPGGSRGQNSWFLGRWRPDAWSLSTASP